EGLCFHILDTVDVRADGILTVGGDALFHLRRGQAGVLPDHRDHRYSYFRKNIRRHRPDGGDAKKQDQGCDHIKRVRKSQRKSNNAHDLSWLRAGCANRAAGTVRYFSSICTTRPGTSAWPSAITR